MRYEQFRVMPNDDCGADDAIVLSMIRESSRYLWRDKMREMRKKFAELNLNFFGSHDCIFSA